MKYGQEGGYGSVPKKKRQGLLIGIVLFIMVILISGGLLYYKFVYSANSIKLVLSKTFDYLETVIDESDYDSVINEFSVQMKFQSTDEEENEVFNIFNKLDFSGNYGIDYDKNIMSLDFYSDYDGKDLIDVSVYTEYGRAYVYLDGLYDKYIDSSVEDYSKFFERNLDDSKNIVVGIRRALEESLKDEYFTVEKVTIDGEKLTKTTMDLTGDNYYEFTNDIVKKLLDNKNFLESYAKIFDKDIDDVKATLNDMVDDSKEYKGEKYFLYTKNLDFVKFEAAFEDDRFVVKNNDGKYEYEWHENGLKLYSGVLEFVENKENSGTVLFSLYDDDDEFGMEINVSVSTKKNGEVEIKDVSNSISYEKISEDDVTVIYNNLMENEGIVKIVEELSNLFNYGDSENSLPVVTS